MLALFGFGSPEIFGIWCWWREDEQKSSSLHFRAERRRGQDWMIGWGRERDFQALVFHLFPLWQNYLTPNNATQTLTDYTDHSCVRCRDQDMVLCLIDCRRLMVSALIFCRDETSCSANDCWYCKKSFFCIFFSFVYPKQIPPSSLISLNEGLNPSSATAYIYV